MLFSTRIVNIVFILTFYMLESLFCNSSILWGCTTAFCSENGYFSALLQYIGAKMDIYVVALKCNILNVVLLAFMFKLAPCYMLYRYQKVHLYYTCSKTTIIIQRIPTFLNDSIKMHCIAECCYCICWNKK